MVVSPFVPLTTLAAALLAGTGFVAFRLPNSPQDGVAAEVGLRGVTQVRVLQTRQWEDRAVALYRGRDGTQNELGVAFLSRSFTHWAGETANDVITSGPLPGPVEISCGSGRGPTFQYTAVYGRALSPAVASVSASVRGKTHHATFGADHGFLLAIPQAIEVRNLVVRDRLGRVLWHASRSCSS